MIRTLLVALLVCFGCGKIPVSAQCVDTTLIQYGAYCDPHWDPVCGCNGYTYTNDCFARNAGVITWFYGICDPVDFVFYPNPPYDHIDIDVMTRVQATIYVQLYDRFGRIYYVNTFPDITRFQFQIQTKGLPIGVYYLNIFTDTGNRVKKIVVPGVD